MSGQAKTNDSAILLIHCDDRPGLVASVTQFIHRYGGNIVDLDQHTDTVHQQFFMRVAWELSGFTLRGGEIEDGFRNEVGERFGMQWQLFFSHRKPKLAIFVSKTFHCLYDILARTETGEWPIEIPLIVSNHADVEPVARRFGIECHVLPLNADNKAEREARQLELLAAHGVELIVLARYMQVLSPSFVRRYPNRIINIHHSFLPAFPGARPYHSAYERGVKIIGATGHYVTPELDEGPIIEQDVVRVTHKDSVAELIRKGRDLEKLVLSRAIWQHLQHKTLVYENRTIVFA